MNITGIMEGKKAENGGIAKNGAKIVINYTSNSEAAESCKVEIENLGSEAIIVQADVSIPSDAETLITTAEEHFGKIDILVNNAGINRDRTVQRMAAQPTE